MISINKEEIQKKYKIALKETIQKNEEISEFNKSEISRIENDFNIAFDKAKIEHDLKIQEIEKQNLEISKINSDNKAIFEIEKQNIELWNNSLEYLMSFKLRIYNSTNIDISFNKDEIIVFEDEDFKEIAQFEISCKEDIEKIKMFLSSEFKLARNRNTGENTFLIKADFGWEDYNGNYFSPIDIEILDKKYENKKMDKKKVPTFKPLHKIATPYFQRPEKEKFVEKKHISLPIIEEETFIGIPQNMNNFNNQKINIFRNGNWKF